MRLRRLSARERFRHPHVPDVDRGQARVLVVPVWLPGIGATTLGPLIVVRRGRERDRRLLAHELVHVRQWRELGAWAFLVRYLGEYFDGRRAGLDHRRAYLGISLEREARALAARAVDG